MANDSGQKGQAQGGFDDILERVRNAVDRLEQGTLSLEDSLSAFEEGVTLARRGHALLDQAEMRVEALTRGPDGQDRATALAASSEAPPR